MSDPQRELQNFTVVFVLIVALVSGVVGWTLRVEIARSVTVQAQALVTRETLRWTSASSSEPPILVAAPLVAPARVPTGFTYDWAAPQRLTFSVRASDWTLCAPSGRCLPMMAVFADVDQRGTK